MTTTEAQRPVISVESKLGQLWAAAYDKAKESVEPIDRAPEELAQQVKRVTVDLFEKMVLREAQSARRRASHCEREAIGAAKELKRAKRRHKKAAAMRRALPQDDELLRRMRTADKECQRLAARIKRIQRAALEWADWARFLEVQARQRIAQERMSQRALDYIQSVIEEGDRAKLRLL